jgi:hypothetical protein
MRRLCSDRFESAASGRAAIVLERVESAVSGRLRIVVRKVQERAPASCHDAAVVDLQAASDFMATHARPLDRRRFDVVLHGAPPDGALAALAAYRNPDAGFGWGLEPDLRASESQPGPALHAFEVFEDILPATSPLAVELCDWLESVSLPDGGLPFALPLGSSAGCAPFWANADPSVSSLQITAVVASIANRVAAGDPAVAGHRWLARATDYCLGAIEAMGDEPHALALAFSVQLLDAVHDTRSESAGLLARLGERIPAGGLMPVGGGIEGELMRPLDFAPLPDRPARRLFAPATIVAELERLAAQQQEDGGWRVDFASYSPAAALEWRGHMTVRALSILRRHGMV